jgi:hypothetical protein
VVDFIARQRQLQQTVGVKRDNIGSVGRENRGKRREMGKERNGAVTQTGKKRKQNKSSNSVLNAKLS